MNPPEMDGKSGRKDSQIQTIAGKGGEPQRDGESLEDFHSSMNRPAIPLKQTKMRGMAGRNSVL